MDFIQSVCMGNHQTIECVALEFRKDLNCQLLPFHHKFNTKSVQQHKSNDQPIIVFKKLTHLILNRVWQLTCDWRQWYVYNMSVNTR